MLIYIIKSAACLAILFLFYKLFLERENMHVFKRFYLLGALLFALIVPAIIFTEYVVVEPQVYEAPLQTPSVMVESTPNIPPALEADVTDIAQLLWIVYFIGLFFFGIKFLRNLFQIFRRIRRNPKYKKSSFIQVLLQEKIPPHTFFKYIFLNKSKFESKEIPKEVILHEETHAKQKHSLDVVFIELLQVIFWINPLICFFKKAIKLNHEFLADQAVLSKNVDTVTYQNTLLSFLSSESAKKYQPSLPNAINYSSIKKRFTIMKYKTSKKAIVIRSLLLLPLLGILLAGFTQKKMIEVQTENLIALEGIWVEKELELTELKIFKQEGHLMLDYGDSKLSQIKEENGRFYSISNYSNGRQTKSPLLIDKEAGTIQSWKRKYIPEGRSLKRKLLGTWKNDKEGVQFIVNEVGNSIVWDIIRDNGFPVRFYPIKKGNTYAITYDKELWSFKLENGLLLDSKGIKYQKVKKTIPQKGITKENLKKYNLLAKKYNAVPLEKRIIPMENLKTLEAIYRNMSNSQREKAEAFPECLPKNVQDGATKEQLAEYNALANKYNDMLQGNHFTIRKSDVDRLEFLHGLMTEEQRANAEPFPDFPEPPPPPAAPEEIEEDMLEMEHEMASQEEAMKEKEGAMIQKEHAMREKQLTKKQQSNDWTVTSSAMRDSRKLTTEQAEAIQESPIPPVTPTIAVLANTDKYSKELKSSIDAYLKKNKNYEKAVAAFSKKKNGDGQDLWNMYNETMELYVNYHVLAKKEGNFVQPVPAYNQRQEKSTTIPNSPPAPPKPESPIDHIIKMARQDAIFYYKGKKITSDKAIDILKKNKKLSISTTKNNDERPVVKIVKHL